jgi:hypothetical protein
VGRKLIPLEYHVNAVKWHLAQWIGSFQGLWFEVVLVVACKKQKIAACGSSYS